jgi:hypothetical protein
VQFPALDPSMPMLIHDLDVRITHVASGVTYLPWALNITTPAAAATTGDNTIDNVEQIDIAGAPAGEYYVTVTVKTPFMLTQDYGLVWRGMRASQPPELFGGANAYIDLGGPDFPATNHTEKGFDERGVFITAIRDVAISEIGMNLAIPFPTPMTVALYEASGTVRGPLVASTTTTIHRPGEIVHYVSLPAFLNACQDYEISVRFDNTVSWPSWDEPPGGSVVAVPEPFDVGAAVRVRDGTHVGLAAPPILPHFVLKGAVLPQQFTDLDPPGAVWGPAPAFNGFAGAFVSPERTISLDFVAFMVGFPAFSDVTLYARVYEAVGTIRGDLIAEGFSRFNNGSSTAIQLWTVPVEAVLAEGKSYDIEMEFPTNVSWEQTDETGVTPVTVGPLRIVDAESEGNPLVTRLGHFHVGWTEDAGGVPFDLSKHNDAIPPPFAAPGSIDNGLYVTSVVSQHVYSLGVKADIPAGETITMRVYEAAGTTRGPLITEGFAISTDHGMVWHDVPLAAELTAGGDYDFEVSVANTNIWRFWDDTLGLPYTAYGVLTVRDAEQGGNAGATPLPEMRMNACDAALTPVDDRTTPPPFTLAAPYPNPVTGVATIDFSVDSDETVSIAVYDVAGRRVALLLDRARRTAGAGAVDFDANGLPSGVYFVKMQTPTRSVSRKITVVK